MIAAAAPKHGRPVPNRLVNLEPRALVRATARRYRRLPIARPSELVLAMLSGDAPAQARLALQRLMAGIDYVHGCH